MKARITSETNYYVACPSCGNEKAHNVGHLFDDVRKLGGGIKNVRWGCSECGNHAEITMHFAHIRDKLPEISIVIDNTQGTNVACYSLLQYFKEDQKLFVIVKDKDYGRGKLGKVPYESKTYFYNEHTCPTNWISDVEVIIQDRDCDPHGVFRYVSSIDADPNIDYDNFGSDEWLALFPDTFGVKD